MELGEDPSQIQIKGASLFVGQGWETVLSKQSPLDHFHHIKLGADYLRILAETIHFGHRDIGIPKGMHYAVLAVNLMG